MNFTTSFQVNFGEEFLQLAADDLSGRSVSLIKRTARKRCCWIITPVHSVGTIKPLKRIMKQMEVSSMVSGPVSISGVLLHSICCCF